MSDSDYYTSNSSSNAAAGTGASSAPNYLRSTYLYSKPTNIDDYTSSTSRPSTASSWRSKYKTLEIDDDDITVAPRYNKYSTCKRLSLDHLACVLLLLLLLFLFA